MTKNTHNRAHALFKKETSVLAWLASIVIILVIANAAAFQPRANTVNQRQAAEVPKASQNLGVLEFSWRDNFSYQTGAYQVQNGFKVIAVNVQVLNLQQRNVWLAPNVESYVVDAVGVKYNPINIEVQNPFLSAIHGPQTTASGTLVYAIPTDTKSPQWCYQLAPANGGGDPVCIAINKYSLDQ